MYVSLCDYQALHLDEDGDFGKVRPPGTLGEPLEAGCGSVCAVDGGEKGHWYPSAHNGQPHGGTHQRRVPTCANRTGAERVDYCQEAVYANTGEEEHAAIDVGDEGCSWYLTQSISKWPVAVNIVEDLEWQRKNKY